MVHRVPEWGSGEFRLGSQLVVRDGQSAVFFRNGKALDTFEAGRHTLTTENIPLLADVLSLPFGGKSPFRAEVYFVSRRTFLDLKWGTPEPVAMRDADLGMVRLRAFGNFTLSVAEPALFVVKIVGTQGLYDTSDILGHLRTILVSRLSDVLGEQQVGLLGLPSMYDELAAAMRARAQDDFRALGVDLRSVYIGSISTTEETQRVIDERAAMGAIGDMQNYLRFKAARALGDAAVAGDSGASAAALGLGAGAGMGAVIGQMMGQAMTTPQPVAADAPASLEQVFTGLQLLVQRQLAVPQADRNALISELEKLRLELAREKPDLEAIRNGRRAITERWSWVGDELEAAFKQAPVTAALVRAAAGYTE
jgi:membrane protease subunit (stomatin/prohibitin family)